MPGLRSADGTRVRTSAVLLAGGRGTRLHELTASDCKPSVHFAGQRRIVDFVMQNVVRSDLRELIVCTQYRPEGLARHLNAAWRPAFGASGLMLRDGPAVTGQKTGYDGTADAVAANIAILDAMRPDHVVVLAADHVYGMDYRPMVAGHVASGAEVTVAVSVVPVAEASAFGVLSVDEAMRVVAFREKPAAPDPIPGEPSSALISMGIYVFAWPWLRQALIADRGDALSGHDFGSDILPAAVEDGVVHAWRPRASAFGTLPYWRDVGTLDAYLAAQIDFDASVPPVALPQPPGAPAEAASSPGLVVGQRRCSIAAPGQWGTIERSVVLPGAHLAPGVRLSRTIVAPGAVLPRGLVVGEDPTDDATWFRRTDAGTTLITAEMLARRQAERSTLYAMPRNRMPGLS